MQLGILGDASGSTKSALDSSTNRWQNCEYPNPARWRISSWVKRAAHAGDDHVEDGVLEDPAVADLEDVLDVGGIPTGRGLANLM